MIRMVTVPGWIQRFFPGRIWSFPAAEETVYLTFDDGPHPEHTPFVLNQLARYDAKATFFCIGKNVEQYPEIYATISAGGHQIGNHTYSHYNNRQTGDGKYLNDVKRAASIIQSDLFRPPYGRLGMFAARLLRKSGYRIVMWDVLSYDFDTGISARRCLENVMLHVRPGSIVVFHDSEKASPHLRVVLPEVLKLLHSKGFRFAPINGLK